MRKALYLLRHRVQTDLVKIGITERWPQRAKQLRVGVECDPLLVVYTEENRSLESTLHDKWSKQGRRLPQAEWFFLSETQITELTSEVASYGPAMEDPLAHLKRKAPKPKPKPVARTKTPEELEAERAAAATAKEQRRLEWHRQREAGAVARRKAEKEKAKREKEEAARKAAAKANAERCRASLTKKELDAAEWFIEDMTGDGADEDLTNLESNPWIDFIGRPCFEEAELLEDGSLGSFNTWILWELPVGFNGHYKGEAYVYPGKTIEDPYEIDCCCPWMHQRFGDEPVTWDELIERLWLLCELPDAQWPAVVISRHNAIERRERRLLAEWAA